MVFKDIEKAGFRSWPALEESEADGIVLRYSNGFTKRANSANLLRKLDTAFEKLASRYEDYFQRKNLPCIFRIPSFTENQAFDSYLDEKGYRYLDRSLVLRKPLGGSNFENVNITALSSREWMKAYCRINDIGFGEHITHLEMLDRIEDTTLFAVLKQGKKELACGLGVMSNGLFGLFDIATKKSARNKGFGTKLITGMLHWAVEHGASSSYLQVVADNKPAIKLYKKIGYEHCYEYWYRIRDKS